MATDAPTSARDLDAATLLSLAGSLAERSVIEAVRARGYHVTRAHGYVFQRLLAGDQTITALAADLRITQQGASKHVAELERLGLVSRRVSPDDRRAKIVGLTDAGREVIDTARRARAQFEERVRAVIGDDLLAATRRALALLLDDAGTSAHIPDRSIPLDE
ncbi:MarR family winged helix-turn-helix transcriptional regulator [Microbacterium sp.]|jgi:DNA-binding MarR family transcriptional regulator|uniref:MarR family winged helix-turn-helix transcriptional regulator n=1 Tax=Microbacterium sp. TaxID=51671 RepID=UPI002C3D757E|nr:MarR family transcriptional regulator [Microbacterium sp.]HWL78737.1 MarR family transcriptional regulator [Microbacterium sp.]